MNISKPHKNPRGRPKKNAAALAFRVGMPPKPDDLSTIAEQFWDYYGPILIDTKMLSPGDFVSFTEFCELCAEIKELKAKIVRDGLYCTAQHGEEQLSPAGKQLGRQRQLLMRLQDRFGLTPAARSNMKTQKDTTADGDPLLKMFESRKDYSEEKAG